MSAAVIPQGLSFALALAGLLVWGAWIRRYRNHWGYAVPPVVWLLHVALFYGAVLAQDFGVLLWIDVMFWSSILRLHSVFLVIGLGLVMVAGRIMVRNR